VALEFCSKTTTNNLYLNFVLFYLQCT